MGDPREDLSVDHAFSAEEIARLVASLGADGTLCPLVVKGTSMSPTLREGRDTVYLRSVGPDDELRRGDVIFFWRGPQVVLHRLIKVLPDGRLRVNGDNQLWCEEVAREDVFAVAEQVGRGHRVMPLRSGALGAWGAVWMRLLPVREAIWHLPRPVKDAAVRLGSALRGGGRRG